jgi:NTE family protein
MTHDGRKGRAIGRAVDVSYRPEEAVLNNAVDVALQAFAIATRHLGQEELALADVVIAPSIGAIDHANPGNNRALIAAGEQAARRAAPEIRAALSRGGARKA